MACLGGDAGAGSAWVWCRTAQTALFFSAFLLLGLTRAMQGPSLMDLQAQANIDIDDFSLVFLLGTASFPLGNVAAGFLLDRLNPLLLMSCFTFGFFAFHTGLAFTGSLAALAACSATMELAMGMVDTGCNVICLRLWRGRHEGPVFTALHFAFALGNILGPILSGCVLSDHHREDADKALNLTEFHLPHPFGSDDVGVRLPPPTRLQCLHLLIGSCLLLLCLCYATSFLLALVSRAPSKKDAVAVDATDAAADPSNSSPASPNVKVIKMSPSSASMSSAPTSAGDLVSPGYKVALFVILTVFFCLGNGLIFGFSSFLSVFATRHPQLELPKSAGARATALFFASSALARLVSVACVARLPSAAPLLCLDLLFLASGSAWLMARGTASEESLLAGVAMVGVGVSTLFSSGMLWLLGFVRAPISARVTSLFLVATSVGAQCFRVPLAYWIEDEPSVLLWSICAGAGLCSALFGVAFALAHAGARRHAKVMLPLKEAAHECATTSSAAETGGAEGEDGDEEEARPLTFG